jgi:hypothetical protein
LGDNNTERDETAELWNIWTRIPVHKIHNSQFWQLDIPLNMHSPLYGNEILKKEIVIPIGCDSTFLGNKLFS